MAAARRKRSRTPAVHYRKPGARETACGLKVGKTRKDTRERKKVTCRNCARTEQVRGK